MLGAYATRLSNSVAAIHLAHFPATTAMQAAPASCSNSSGAVVERADSVCTVWTADSSCNNIGITAFSRASPFTAVVLLTFPPGSVGVGDARVRCAVAKGTMLEADKIAKHLRSVAGWIRAGQLHCVLAAQATPLLRDRAATTFQTFP